MSAGPPVAVLGGGLAGLVAARELRRRDVPVTVFEAGDQVAGLASSYVDEEGFTNDTGAHFVTNRLAAALGVSARCRVVEHYGETVVVGGRTRDYPGGLLAEPRYVTSALAGRIGALRHGGEPVTAADWFRARYGRALADEVALPLVEAWSGAPAGELAASVGAKIPPGLAHTLRLSLTGRIAHRAVAIGYCREAPETAGVHHVYPQGGGVASFCDALAADLGDVVRLGQRVERIHVEGGRAVGVRVGGVDHEASAVVSTAPVTALARLVAGTDRLAHLARFRYRPMIFVQLRLVGRGLLPDVVTWVPEARFPFFRLTEAPLAMPWLAPEGRTMLTVDLGAEVGDERWTASDETLVEECLDHLEELVPDVRRRSLGAFVLRVPLAYPVFLLDYEPERVALERSTGVDGLLSIGRNGEFAHILMEDVYWRTVRRVAGLARDLGAAG